MNSTLKMLAALACTVPLAALAQTTPPAPADTTGAAPPPGMESKKSTETGKSTTYPKAGAASDTGQSPSSDKAKNKITRGDKKSSESPVSTMDPSTTQKPAKEGSQSGPTK